MSTISLVPELSEHAEVIDALHKTVFGPGAFARAAFRLREQGPHDERVSYVVLSDGELIASVRMTPVRSGSGHLGYLLGPLAVDPKWQNAGYGKALVNEALLAVDARSDAQFVILVGDAPYYAPLGFQMITPSAVTLPGPVDPRRLLVRVLGGKPLEGLFGMIRHAGSV
ncbi:MAG: N-acetyltransferase [Pseudomonadota bacterium]